MTNFKKKIGITLRVTDEKKYVEKRDSLSHDWSGFLEKIECIPIFIPNTITNKEEFLNEINVQGFILSGGDNINDSPERDSTEKAIIEFGIKNKIPLFGICRGMQVLTVSQGIPLYIDIKHELGIKNRRYTLDLVSVNDENSLIKSLMKKSKFRGVELHHQGLHVPYFLKHIENWPHLNLTATSNGGKIGEVLEFSNRPVLGVQFHPEYTFGKVRQNLFKWLLNKACENKTQL